jgi:hypothetical protein
MLGKDFSSPHHIAKSQLDWPTLPHSSIWIRSSFDSLTKTGMVKIEDRSSLLAFYGKDNVKFKELSGEPVL